MRPLPTTEDAERGRARYAELRAEALAGWARALEARSRTLAHRLWRHAACLAPEHEGYRAAVARTRPVRVHRPPVRAATPEGRSAGRALSDSPAEALAAPLVVARPTAERILSQGLAALREARFEAALAQASRARALLAGDAGAGGPRARAEVLAATAQLALGREGEARKSLQRALRADPALRLAPEAHSPKVIELLEAVRYGRPRSSSAPAEGADAAADPRAGAVDPAAGAADAGEGAP